MTAKVMTRDEWELAVADAEVAKIFAMSDEEVLAECRRGGEDPEQVAAEMQAMVRRILGDKPHS